MARCVNISFQIVKSHGDTETDPNDQTMVFGLGTQVGKFAKKKCSSTSAPAGPFPEPADPTMRSIFAILVKRNFDG